MSLQKFSLFALAIILIEGCTSQQPIIKTPVTPTITSKPKLKPKHIYRKHRSVRKLHKVQDHNFSPEYMYPDTSKTPTTVSSTDTQTNIDLNKSYNSMSKKACVEMVGQERFDKYTQMLGSESAAIKRCVLLKSIR